MNYILSNIAINIITISFIVGLACFITFKVERKVSREGLIALYSIQFR